MRLNNKYIKCSTICLITARTVKLRDKYRLTIFSVRRLTEEHIGKVCLSLFHLSATMDMETDIQVSKNSEPLRNTEFLKPDQPITSINLSKIDNKKRTQGAKRANEQEEGIDDSNDDLASYSDTSTKSIKGKKQRSEKNQTASQRITTIEASNKKLVLELGKAFNKITVLENKIDDLENIIKELLDKSKTLPSTLGNQTQASIEFWSKLPKQTTYEITQAVRQETALLDKKEKNVIIFGVPESVEQEDNLKTQNDKRSIENILTAINVKSEIGEFKFRRLKNKSQNQNTTGPIIIEFESSSQKFKVLKASIELENIKTYL